MNRIAIYGAVAVLVVVGLVAVLMIGGGGARAVSTSASSTVSGAASQQSNNTGTLFSSEPYYGYSYLIAPGSVSQQAKIALDGYNMTSSQQANGTESVTLKVVGTNRNVTGTLSAGEKLYIVETSFGDDGPNYEGSFGDDGFVVVSQGGYVVNTFVV